MDSTNRSSTLGMIVVLETFLLFFMGIIGTKISDLLQISNSTLLALTVIGLILLATVSYLKSKMTSSILIQSNQSRVSLIPKTMVGVFPFGVLLGISVGALIPSVNLGYYEVDALHPYEVAGIIIGVIICVLFALLVEGHLAAALAIGYGIAFATAILVIQPEQNDILQTYFGHTLTFSIIGIILVIMEPLLKWLRKIVTEQRISE